MSSWTLLHPWLLAGLAGASLPILIHLIGRRRAPLVRFAAFDFLMAVNKRLARRERLRQLLLLLLRTLAVMALVLAVARPMPERPAAAAAQSRRLALVVDTSASMAYVYDGTSLLERAKGEARELLSHLRPGDSIALVLAGEDVRVPFQTPTLDTAAVRAVIDKIEQPAGVADMGAAIEQALSLLGSDAAGATLVVISDLARNSFAHLRPTALDPAPEIRLVDAAGRDEPGALANVAVEGITVERGTNGTAERRFRVVVRNYGRAPIANRALELLVGDRVTQRGYVDVPAHASAEKSLTLSFDAPGVYHGSVRLAGEDGLLADDFMPFVTVVAPGVRVLAVDGDPRTTPHDDELFFVERALEAVPRGDPSLHLRIITADELTATAENDLSGFDVVLLANVAALPSDELERLRRFVQNGGGLFFAPGSKVLFERANELFAELLAHPLRDVHRAADPDAGTPPLGIGELDWDHPILHDLGLAAEESLRASRTSTYFNLDVGAGVKARTLLRFDNGAPALVERPEGKGRVMLLATTLDVDWSDLALRTTFPAVMQRAVRYLAHAMEVDTSAATRAGGAAEIAVPTGARAVALTSPGGVRREETAEGKGRRVRFAELEEVGVHRAAVLRADWAAEPRLDVAVSPSLLESDFEPVQLRYIAEALGGEAEGSGISVSIGAGSHGDPFEARGAAPYLLLALVLLFVSEGVLASRG